MFKVLVAEVRTAYVAKCERRGKRVQYPHGFEDMVAGYSVTGLKPVKIADGIYAHLYGDGRSTRHQTE